MWLKIKILTINNTFLIDRFTTIIDSMCSRKTFLMVKIFRVKIEYKYFRIVYMVKLKVLLIIYGLRSAIDIYYLFNTIRY